MRQMQLPVHGWASPEDMAVPGTAAPRPPSDTAPKMQLPGAVGDDLGVAGASGNTQSSQAGQSGSTASQIAIAELEREISRLRDELREARSSVLVMPGANSPQLSPVTQMMPVVPADGARVSSRPLSSFR